MISEAFWLRELGALQTPIIDIIGFSEVITSEKFGPVNPKYREYAHDLNKAARLIMDRMVQRLDESKSQERKSGLKRKSDLKQQSGDALASVLMSHEIRSPLNVIIGFAEIMMRSLFGPMDDPYQAYAEDIHSSGMLLLDVINDLLDLARVEAERIELDEGSVDVEKAVQESLREAMPQAVQGQVTLTWVPSVAKLPNLLCDRRRLRQMLLNILSSAAKFDKPGRMVEVGTDFSDGPGIVIRDTGWGILMDSLKLILTKCLMEQHGGNLLIASMPNDGVTVRLLFPSERILRSEE